MRILLVFLIMGLLSLRFGCSSMTVKQDFDQEYDFNAFKTYRWAAGKEINPQDELQKYPPVYKRVVAAVDKALAIKGVKQVKGDDFDVVVVAHAGSKEHMQVHQTGGYYTEWYYPWWGSYGDQTTVSYYKETTLVIDIVS